MADPTNIDGRPVLGGAAQPVTIMNGAVPVGGGPSGGAVPAAITSFKGAANMANGQVTTSGAAGTAVAARATRRSVTIKNTDTTITVYIGIATVTAGNGMPLKAGESISLDTTALVQVIAASGTPVIAYCETFD